MTYTVFATNRPDLPLEVDDAELVDLIRQGLLVKNKGDIGPKGTLLASEQDEGTPPEVKTPIQQQQSTTPKQEA